MYLTQAAPSHSTVSCSRSKEKLTKVEVSRKKSASLMIRLSLALGRS